jgi:uncharacterized membrane-anchored protein YhcB (DUF1043 family)
MASGMELGWTWGMGFLGFAFGIAVGMGLAYLTICNSRRRAQELQEKCDALQREFESYRGEVGQHFLRTSELVQKMTESYRDVYEHLASGSQVLCQNPVNTPSLDLPDRPMLDARRDDSATRSEPATASSTPESPDSDDYFGDSPHVPTLEMHEEQASTTRQTP